jgi:hypothetical protein
MAKGILRKTSSTRLTASFEYRGTARPIEAVGLGLIYLAH